MPNERRTVSRPLVGWIAIGLFAAAGLLEMWPALLPGAAGATLAGAAARVGIVMGALWLALPTRNRPAAWANLRVNFVAVGLLAVMALLRIPFRIMLPLAGTVLALGAVFRPKSLERPRPKRDAD